jgi:sulfatase modifying factor 1
VKRSLLWLSVLWPLALCGSASAAPPYPVTMSMTSVGNPVADSRGPRCDAALEIETDQRAKWWIAVGEARPDSPNGWKAVGATIRCGRGSTAAPGSGSGDGGLVPYLVATVEAVPWAMGSRLGADIVLQVEISLSVRKLAGFSDIGAPRYDQSAHKRTVFFQGAETAFLPLMVTDVREREAFGLHEVLVGIQATLVRHTGVAAYGMISVSSDLDGAELRLDGGAVGRVSAGRETVLANVPVGDREVSVRDASGIELHRVVRVEEKRTALVSLSRPDPARDAVRHRLTSLGDNASGFREYRREWDGTVVVKIPAGEFLMGNRNAERQPLEHLVDLTAFLIDKTAVTWRQFRAFGAATGTALPPNPPYWGMPDDHPAVFVTWEEARAYCDWVGGRLPTEAEREKAARGTDGRMYPWGNEPPDPLRAVFRRNWGDAATDPVDAHPSGASPYGLLNAGGNVWEYVADWYDDKYYEVSPKRDPRGPRTGMARVSRGGSWDSRPAVLSASVRNWTYRGYREGDFGFRCAMDPVD